MSGKSMSRAKYRRIPYVAEQLDISPRSVQRLIARGELPAIKIGGVVRICDDDIHLLLARLRIRHDVDI